MTFRLLLLLLLFSLPLSFLSAQSSTLQGSLVDAVSGQAIADALVRVENTGQTTRSDQEGRFRIVLAQVDGVVTLIIEHPSYNDLTLLQEVVGELVELGPIRMKSDNPDLQIGEDLVIPTITLDEDADNDFQSISSILSASRDPFLQAAAFNFSAARYRVRGLGSEYTQMFLNGAPFVDLEDSRADWSTWGGLNDVFRNQEIHLGLEATDYAIGGTGGSTLVDLRAASQRRQKRLSVSKSNRTYRNRVMGTWSTGLMNNGWAFSLSASRRWAEEGYIEATPYETNSWFVSVGKKFSEKHLLHLTAFGVDTERGRISGSVQEMYDLADSRYYNSYWGFQDGKKRNSRIERFHQPVVLLNHDWTLSDRTSIHTALSVQSGPYGRTALDWYDARDPRPDYYQKLPSYILDPVQKERVAELLRNDQSARQLDWAYMYEVNRNSLETIVSPEETVSGLRSHYILEDRRNDSDEANLHIRMLHQVNEMISLQGGLGYRYQDVHNYKVVEDLLGGDFYVDLNAFAVRDFPADQQAIQNDLNNPNRILREGDVWGYDYDSRFRQAFGWGQSVITLPKFDILLGAELSRTNFWRTGFVRNGLFPDDSEGDSDIQEFLNYSLKGGLTYKLDGRNYFVLNGSYRTKAPIFRDVYISPRTRNQAVEDPESEKIFAGELSYNYRSPYFKARLTGYYLTINDQISTRSFFHDEERSFVNFTLTGIDQQNFGMEISLEAEIMAGLSATFAGGTGQFTYTSRPQSTITQDNNAEVLESRTVYMKNFYVPGTPQTVGSLGLRYRGAQYYTVALNANYFTGGWLDFNPDRRTETAISFDQLGIDRVEPGSDLWENILFQESIPSAFTLDFFGTKSFKFGNTFLYLTAGVSNILNNQFRSGGFEQLRFDYEEKNVDRFPPRYFYSFGTNYFLNLAVRI